jgi:nitrogen fixation protein FixH
MSAVRLIPEKIEGRHVLFALLAFFGVTFLVNGIFLYYAVGTFNGFETTDAYRKGVTYNERIASEAAQATHGWKPLVRYEVEGQQLIVEVRDRQGRGVAGLVVMGEVRRPVTDSEDREVTLHESAPARYAVSLKLAAGQWIFSGRIFETGKSGRAAFRFKQRLWVRTSP